MQLLFALFLWIQPPQEVTFTILHTNDEHSALIPAPLSNPETALGGMARLATELRFWRDMKATQNEPLFVVSAGDFSTGTPFNWLVFDNTSPELDLMLKLRYDLVVLGNHEFDYGPEKLAEYLARVGYPAKAADTPLLSANIRIPDGHPLGDMGITAHHIEVLPSGVKVGFFGLMGKDAADVAPYKTPVEFDPIAEAAREQIRQLKAKGAQVFIAVTHSGVAEDIELATAVPELHLIVGGHSHTLIPEPKTVGSTLVVQAGALLQYLGVLEIAFDPAKGTIRLLNAERGTPYVRQLSSEVADDPAMAAEVAVYQAALDAKIEEWTGGRVADIATVLSTTGFPLPASPELQETPMGNFVTDAIRAGVAEATGKPVDVAFMANGVIRGSFPAGPIPFYDLASYVGLGSGPDDSPGYPLVSAYFTGTELRRILEITILLSRFRGDTYYLQVSGLKYEFDADRAAWFRIPFKGTPIPSAMAVSNAWRVTADGDEELTWEDDRLYHVVTDYYNASFLPFVGEVVPSLKLVIKDENGNPVSLDDRIITKDGKPYKVWQAVADYAMKNPVMPASYQAEFQRQIPVPKTHMMVWVWLGLGALVVVIWGIRKRKSGIRNR